MLKLRFDGGELFDSETSRVDIVPAQTLRMEHSLLSISKWESIWEKPFLTNDKSKHMTFDEFVSYMTCMCLDEVDERVFFLLKQSHIDEVDKYLRSAQTATIFYDHFKDPKQVVRRHTITSEIIYYWMTCFNIPFECERWNFNRLMTLIQVCDDRSSPKKKRSSHDISQMYRDLNERRMRELGTKG